MQHETRKHARLSASRTDRFMQCPGSYRLESIMPYEPAGEAAAIGTAIHELSEIILRGGENIYPAEIEQRIEAHAAIMEVCVVGVADNELGQIVKAVCVLKDEANVDAAELTLWCAEALAYFKVPALWEIGREPLPRNATGKVVKAVLTQQADLHFIEED